MSKRRAAGSHQPSAKMQTYKAGCGRTWNLASGAPDLAYTMQEFAECGGCRHRVEPDAARPFCTLRPQDAPHPFAALAALGLAE